jgi:acyl CoA:acetate/3-ketoacid CoA transferase alpha subunit
VEVVRRGVGNHLIRFNGAALGKAIAVMEGVADPLAAPTAQWSQIRLGSVSSEQQRITVASTGSNQMVLRLGSELSEVIDLSGSDQAQIRDRLRAAGQGLRHRVRKGWGRQVVDHQQPRSRNGPAGA